MPYPLIFNENTWVYQTNSRGIGDFLFACPTIQTIASTYSTPIPTFFDNKHLAQLFKDCPYIKVLPEKPNHNFYFSTAIDFKWKSNRNAYIGYHYTILGNEDTPPPFLGDIPPSSIQPQGKPFFALFHGRGPTGLYRYNKDFGAHARQHAINRILDLGFVPVLLGSECDRLLFWNRNNLENCIDLIGKLTLAETTAVINICSYFLSNDTALYHIASALGKPGMVIWNETWHSIYFNPYDNHRVHHLQSVYPVEYPQAINSYLERVHIQ